MCQCYPVGTASYSPNSACTEGVLVVLGKKVLWLVCWPVHDTRPLIVAAIYNTSCMSPSPLCSEMVVFFKYAVNYNTKSLFLLSDGPWCMLGTYLAPLGAYSDDIWVIFRPNMTKHYQKCNFWKMSMSQNSKNVDFSGTKAPQGASRRKGAFQDEKMKM